MCLNPVKIVDVGWVACRECWQCRERKVDDWVGRNIAESKTATAAHVVTLTYGEDAKIGSIDHIRAAVLTYSDVQKYLKHLRSDGFPVRYFVVGEYGSKKGRAHWHIVLYWQGAVPEHKLRENFAQKHWPHGWSYWDKVSPSAIRYACKYLQKDAHDDARQGFGPMPSKKPPLGDAYFKQLADKYVEQGLVMHDLFYSFPEVTRVPLGLIGKTIKVRREALKPVRFMMSGKTAENFVGSYVKRREEVYNDLPPRSDVVLAYLDKQLRAYLDKEAQFSFQPRPVSRVPIPKHPPYGGSPVLYSEPNKCCYSIVDGVKLWYSYDSEGDLQWHEKIRPDAMAERRKAAQAEAASRLNYRSLSRGL